MEKSHMVCKGKMEGTISTFPGHQGKLEQLISWPRFHQACSLECYNSTNRIRKFESTSTKQDYKVIHQCYKHLLANLCFLLWGTKDDKCTQKAWKTKLLIYHEQITKTLQMYDVQFW